MAFNPNLRRIAVAALWSGLAVSALGSVGCAAAGKALGVNKTVPDEFRVVARAPLVVPPDYSLRPPSPGEPRPQELQPESQARAALLGQAAATQRSQGETLLVAKAGGEKADPLIRYVVDDEFGDVSHKDKNFADKVMFWKKGEPRSPAAEAAAQPAPLDPAAEDAKIKSLTGGQQVVISRAKPGKVKLPGL
ncbi:MAG TPA: DUF3035 domain-containing protein [Caulobacteraceae bacterium]|jgi:hypothetical protein|nr:DUF3035 domain-containing protein [Caulobacteraceae bacterium]